MRFRSLPCIESCASYIIAKVVLMVNMLKRNKSSKGLKWRECLYHWELQNKLISISIVADVKTGASTIRPGKGNIPTIRPLRNFCRTSENIWQNNGLTNVGLDYTDTHRPQLWEDMESLSENCPKIKFFLAMIKFHPEIQDAVGSRMFFQGGLDRPIFYIPIFSWNFNKKMPQKVSVL